MSKLLSVFLDGIKPSSVKHMPFLSSFENKANLTTDVGFSTTCHASMYSGVYPEKHGIWHSMLYNPTTSPYKWLEDSGVSRIPDLDILKYLAFRATKKFGKRNDSFFGIQYIRTSSFRNWPKISF